MGTGPLTPAELKRRRARRVWLKRVWERRALARAVIESGYRQQARLAHPDAGGSADAMHALTTVRDALLRAVADRRQTIQIGWLYRTVHLDDEILMGTLEPRE